MKLLPVVKQQKEQEFLMEGTPVLDRVGTQALQRPFDSVHSVPIIPASEEVQRYGAQLTENEARPMGILISELAVEQELKEKTACLMGRVAVTEAAAEAETPMTLKDAAEKAKEGDQEARKMVRSNVTTDYLERTYKTKQVIRVVLTADQQNKLGQHGQTIEDVNLNTQAHVKGDALVERGEIEAHNGTRQEHCYEQGLLKNNVILTWSTVFDEISREVAAELGYFTEHMSCAVQMVTEEEGEVVLYSAFVAGSDSKEGKRFDFDAIVATAAELGIDYSGMSSNEILAEPGLIPKALLPKGILTVVEKYDDYIPGEEVRFFGRVHEGQRDYEGHMLECRRREEAAQSHIKAVTDRIIAAADTFTCPADATKLLDTLNHQELTKNIVHDKTIDTNVLGAIAQPHIEEARLQAELGNDEALAQAERKIRQYGKSSSCPSGQSAAQEAVQSGDDGGSEDEGSSKKKWMSCPYCSAKVYDDPCATVLACWDCKALAVEGKIVSTGNGGSKKRREEAAAKARERAEQEARLKERVDEAFRQQGVESFEIEQQKAAQPKGQLVGVGRQGAEL